MSGYPPFADGNLPIPLNEQIKRGAYAFHQQYWHRISNDAVDLIKQMLTVDPKKRISIDKVLCHKWLQVRNISSIIHDSISVKLSIFILISNGIVFSNQIV